MYKYQQDLNDDNAAKSSGDYEDEAAKYDADGNDGEESNSNGDGEDEEE